MHRRTLPAMVTSDTVVLLCPRSFFKGFRMAKYLSAENPVKVNTEIPMLISFMNSENLQINSPKGQDSIVYRVDVNGIQKTITSRSPTAMERMNLFQFSK